MNNLNTMPFSRFGSYLTVVSRLADDPRKPAGLEPGYWLAGVHGFHSAREIFRIEPLPGGDPQALIVERHPSHLRLATPDSAVELCLAEPELVRLRVRGAGVRLSLRKAKYNYAIPQNGRRWLINTAQAFVFHTAHALTGELAVRTGDGDVILELTPGADGFGELALHQHVGFAKSEPVVGTFDEAVGLVAAEFDRFLAPYLPAPEGLEETVQRAALLNWSCVVGPRGHFRRPSMLMSKNWMSNVWSWDHAINALALADGHPELARDQLLTIFDHQLPSGQLPDFINDAVRLYNYVKPPVHGWILSRMLERNPWFGEPERLAAFYEPLARWTDWWFHFRVREGETLPDYYHGNDSGWDNGTVFDVGTPVVSADLAAFLVLQMETLADLARRLGKNDESKNWSARADSLLQRLLTLWNGRRFRTVNAAGAVAAQSDSIFTCLPIVLGRRLPEEIRTGLVAEIRRHLTDWGLATEHPQSSLYESAGYWRGPIWAPPTLIITDGLRQAGENDLATEIARRFCRLCRKSGFAENYDAVTGGPLCDPAYTWTSSVFLIMARE